MEVSKEESITGVAFWGGSATSPAFDITADIKEIWIKLDLCMRGTIYPCPFQVGHYSKTLDDLVSVENGGNPHWQGGDTLRNSFLIDTAPTMEIITGITVNANALHRVLLHNFKQQCRSE